MRRYKGGCYLYCAIYTYNYRDFHIKNGSLYERIRYDCIKNYHKRVYGVFGYNLYSCGFKNFYAKYGAYIDRRSALNFSDIYDYILTGAPKPERLIEQEKAGQNKDFGQNL